MFGAITSGLSAVANVITIGNAVGASSGNEKYIDYFTTLWKLAELNFCPIGTKLVFSGHHITYSYPMFQGVQRAYVNSTSGGAHAQDLVSLLPGIYYGLKVLDPYNNPCTRVFSFLAWRGTLLLEAAYRAEGDKATAQLLKRHSSLFEEFFTGKVVDPTDYDIPELSHHTLKILSDNHWMTEGNFWELHAGMMEALDISVKGQGQLVDRARAPKYDACKTHLRVIVAEKIKTAVATIANNVSAAPKVDFVMECPSETPKLSEAIKTKLWKWVKLPFVDSSVPATEQSFIKRIRLLGVPIEDSLTSKAAHAALMQWINPPPQIDAVPSQPQNGYLDVQKAPDPSLNTTFIPPHKLAHDRRTQQREQIPVGSIPNSYYPRGQFKSPEARGSYLPPTQHSAPGSSTWKPINHNSMFQDHTPPSMSGQSYTSYYTYEYPNDNLGTGSGWKSTTPSESQKIPAGNKGDSNEDEDNVIFDFDDDEFQFTPVSEGGQRFLSSDEEGEDKKMR